MKDRKAWGGMVSERSFGTQPQSGPAVRERGYGPGPYGSWNEDEGRGDIEDDEGAILKRNLTGADDQFDTLFDAELRSSVLVLATSRLNAHLNRALTQTIRKNQSRDFFAVHAPALALEVVEDAVHASALELSILGTGALSPRGLTKLMDHLLTGTESLVDGTARRLIEGYNEYLEARDGEL